MMKYISVVIIGLVIALFLVYNYFYSVDFPFQDDFLFINFANKVANGLAPTAFFQELFHTDNDHKAVIPRLVVLINYWLTGHLNFRAYIGLVSVNLLYILYFIYRQFSKLSLPLYYFLPIPFLYLQPQHYEVSLWAINGMQHSFLTVFLVTAIMLGSRPSRLAYFGAILCCFLATFTHGNGILSFPALVFYFLCYKDFRKALGVGVFMVLALVLYLGGYETGQAASLPSSIDRVLANFLGFIGANMAQWTQKMLYPILWGGIILLFAGFLVYEIALTYRRKSARVDARINVKLLTLFCFIVISSLVIAVFRSWMGTTLASRFELYAALSSCIFYLLLLGYFPFIRRKYTLLTLILLSVLMWGHSYYEYTGTVASRKTTYLADIYNWTTYQKLLSVDVSLQRNAAFYLFPAYERKILAFPPPIITRSELDSLMNAQPNKRLTIPIYFEKVPLDIPQSEIDTLEYLVNDTYPKPTALFNDRFLVLRGQKSQTTLLLAANPKTQGKRVLLTRAEFYKNGFLGYLRKNNFPDDRYDLGLLDVDSNGKKEFSRFTNVLVIKDRRLSLVP